LKAGGREIEGMMKEMMEELRGWREEMMRLKEE